MIDFDFSDNSSAAGYICNGCGMWVNAGDYHICPMFNRQTAIIEKLDSLIDRLEKINENLEKIIEKMI